MAPYITGTLIKELREKNGMTQSTLAEKLCVSDKAVSKWETGKGFPDISLFESIAEIFGVSISELLSGTAIRNTNTSSNMMRSRFYVCPICGNIILSSGEASVSCHGINLVPLEADEADEKHNLDIEVCEDEYYVTSLHEMTKQHYISFVAAVTSDSVKVIKQYPEGNLQARFKMNGIRFLYFYCNRDGFYKQKIR